MRVEQITSEVSLAIIRLLTLYLERRDALNEAEREMIVEAMMAMCHPIYRVTVTPDVSLDPFAPAGHIG